MNILELMLVTGCCVLVVLDRRNARQSGSKESLPIFQRLLHRPFYFYGGDGRSLSHRGGFATHSAISGKSPAYHLLLSMEDQIIVTLLFESVKVFDIISPRSFMFFNILDLI